MTELIDSGFTIKNACNLSGYSRSLVYYKAKERHIPLDQEMSEKISEIIVQRPSYGTRRVTAMIRRSGLTVNRKKVRRHMKEMNLLHSDRKRISIRNTIEKVCKMNPQQQSKKTGNMQRYITYASNLPYDLLWWLRTEKNLKNQGEKYFVCNHHMGDTFIFCSYLSKLNRITGKNYGVIIPEAYTSIPRMFGLKYIISSYLPRNRGFNDFYYIMSRILRMNTLPSVCGYIEAIKLGGKEKVDLYNRSMVYLGLKSNELPDKPFYFSSAAKEKVTKILQSSGYTGKWGVILAPYAKTINEIPLNFWVMLTDRLRELGYTVFINVSNYEKELPNTIPVSPTPEELIILAREIGWVISVRSGLCDLLLPTGINLTVIYSDDFLKRAISDIFINENVQKMFPTKLEQIVLRNHKEKDFLSAIEKISEHG